MVTPLVHLNKTGPTGRALPTYAVLFFRFLLLTGDRPEVYERMDEGLPKILSFDPNGLRNEGKKKDGGIAV